MRTATEYLPPDSLIKDDLRDLKWGVRSIKTFGGAMTQYLVYRPDGRNVLGSGDTPERAAWTASTILRRESVRPEDLFEDLRGFTFSSRIDDKVSRLVIHECRSAEGVVMGESVDGRESAAKVALRHSLMLRDHSTLTLEEFSQVAATVKVLPRTNGVVLDGFLEEGADLRRGVGLMWDLDPGLRTRGVSREDYVRKLQGQLLGVSMDGGAVKHMMVKSPGSGMTFNVIFHLGAVNPRFAIEQSHRLIVGDADGERVGIERNQVDRPRAG